MKVFKTVLTVMLVTSAVVIGGLQVYAGNSPDATTDAGAQRCDPGDCATVCQGEKCTPELCAKLCAGKECTPEECAKLCAGKECTPEECAKLCADKQCDPQDCRRDGASPSKVGSCRGSSGCNSRIATR